MLTPAVNPLPVNYYAIDPGPVRAEKAFLPNDEFITIASRAEDWDHGTLAWPTELITRDSFVASLIVHQ